MPPVIQIENVSKLYKLGFYGADTFRDEVLNFFARLRGKPPVNSVVGATNNLADPDADTDLVWALKDINLTVNQGDIVGIIGKNGAGKSTLLKILSKITTPTTGSIKIRGRIASLLEVGTGMHQELTGRENIFLNGAILGMTKHEIQSKLDDIIDFAGIARYIDTPIKRYSSGMRVRLGFAIAAHLDPEILIVDEVLAVGDAEFQKRAIGKMQDISKGEGRTVLFVSHNMGSVRNLCKSVVVLENGEIIFNGNVQDGIEYYLQLRKNKATNISHCVINDSFRKGIIRTKEIEFLEIDMLNDINNMSNEEPIELKVKIQNNKPQIKQCQFGIAINNAFDEEIGVCYTGPIKLSNNNTSTIKIIIHNHQLVKGTYYLVLSICQNNFIAKERTFDVVYKPIIFKVEYIDSLHKTSFANWDKKCSILLNHSITTILQ